MLKKRRAYLTIDDSPSDKTIDLVEFLKSNHIPAILFCRGDYLEKNPAPVIQAVKKGFVIGNHLYAHTRASTLDFNAVTEEILRTEDLINEAYRNADKQRPGKYIRFPHMDDGTGGPTALWHAPDHHRDYLIRFFSDGLNISLSPPAKKQTDHYKALRSWLQDEGFTPPPFKDIRHDWYLDSRLHEEINTMYTFSTSDWMLTGRHLKRDWPYKTLEDLKMKINNDPGLNNTESAHVILAHDQSELFEVTTALIQYFLQNGFEFLDF